MLVFMERGERRELEARAARVRDLAGQAIGRADALRDTIDDMLDSLRAPDVPEEAEVRAMPPPEVRASAPRVRRPPAPPPPDPRTSVDTARLVAIEMAVAGRGREEVGRHLRAEFSLEDPEALLDDVFGSADPERSAGSV